VFRWCTDYRDTDGRFSRRRPRIDVLQRERNRVVRVVSPRGRGRGASPVVEIIALRRPDRWHLDQYGVEDDETVDYRLRRIGRRETRLEAVSRETWKRRRAPPRAEYEAYIRAFWDRLRAALERDYRAGRPAVDRA
jgi:hypothetical protein